MRQIIIESFSIPKTFNFIFVETQGILKPEPKWYRDVYGLIFNEFAPSFIQMITLLPLIGCLAGLDPTNFVLPKPCGLIQQCIHFLLRFILFAMTCTQMFALPITFHSAVFIFLLYSKTCIEFLKRYKKRTAFRLERQPTLVAERALEAELSKLDTMSDLEMYRIISIVHRLSSCTMTLATPILMGAGFCIDVTCNYVVVMLPGKIPLLVYLSIVLVAITGLVIIMVEVPQAGYGHSMSADLIKYWRKGTLGLKSLRRKTLNSFRPIGISAGPFFVMNRDTFFSFGQEILNKTVDFILLL